MLKSRMCFPRAAGCKRCLGSVKRATRGHAPAIWETQYPLLAGSVLFAHSGHEVTNWGDPEPVQPGGAELCAPVKRNFQPYCSQLNTLYGSCHSAKWIFSSSEIWVCYILSFNIAVANTTAPRWNAHQCLIDAKTFPETLPIIVTALNKQSLQPFACWDCGFESHRGHGYLSVVTVVCCQVERSLRRADHSCIAVCDLDTSWIGWPWPTGGCCAKKRERNQQNAQTLVPYIF